MNLDYTNGTISIAPAIALIEAGLEHHLTKIDFATSDQTKADYLSINPKGRVPALVLDGGAVLTETGALLEYIAALAPEAELVPAAPESAAHFMRMCHMHGRGEIIHNAAHMRGGLRRRGDVFCLWRQRCDIFE